METYFDEFSRKRIGIGYSYLSDCTQSFHFNTICYKDKRKNSLIATGINKKISLKQEQS